MCLFAKILFTIAFAIIMIGIVFSVVDEFRNNDYFTVTRLNGKVERYPVNSWADKVGWAVLGLVFEFICLGVIFGYIWV